MSAVLHAILPPEIKLVARLVLLFVCFRGFIKFNLLSLGVSYFVFQVSTDFSDVDGDLLNITNQLGDLLIVKSAVLFESKVILLLLTSCQGPLFEFFLVPIHLKFELVHALVRLEDHILYVVEPVLLVSDALLKLFNFVLEATTLALSDLF